MRKLKAPDDSNLCHHCGPCAVWSQVRTAVGKAGGARGKFQEQQEQKTVVFQFLTSTEASDFSTGLWSSTENTAQWEWTLARALIKWWACNRHGMWSLPALTVSLSQQCNPSLAGWHCLPCRTTASALNHTKRTLQRKLEFRSVCAHSDSTAGQKSWLEVFSLNSTCSSCPRVITHRWHYMPTLELPLHFMSFIKISEVMKHVNGS